VQIDRYDPDTVIQGLLDGEGYTNRVAGSCMYRCPRCRHRIRFRWKHFLKADHRSFIKRDFRNLFNGLVAHDMDDEHGFLDFHCPTCQAPTRLTFTIHDYTEIAYHYDIDAVFVGERLT